MTSNEIEKDMRGRTAAVDWAAVAEAIAARGFATLPGFLDAAECAALIALDTEDARFRKRIEMARHNFGEGSYGYFADPLPPIRPINSRIPRQADNSIWICWLIGLT